MLANNAAAFSSSGNARLVDAVMKQLHEHIYSTLQPTDEFTDPRFTFSLARARTETLKWRCKKKQGACMHGSNPESEKATKAGLAGNAHCSLQPEGTGRFLS